MQGQSNDEKVLRELIEVVNTMKMVKSEEFYSDPKVKNMYYWGVDLRDNLEFMGNSLSPKDHVARLGYGCGVDEVGNIVLSEHIREVLSLQKYYLEKYATPSQYKKI